jgi:hypothetical protein
LDARGQVLFVIGAAWTVLSVSSASTFGVIIGPVLALISAGPVLARIRPGE